MKKAKLKKIFMENVSVEELTKMAINNYITLYDSGMKDAERSILPVIENMTKDELVDFVLAD